MSTPSPAPADPSGSGDGRPRRGPRRGRGGRRPSARASTRDDEARTTARRARAAEVRQAVDLPPITYPEQLPVSARRAEISDALRDHQVVVVAGETGSG